MQLLICRSRGRLGPVARRWPLSSYPIGALVSRSYSTHLDLPALDSKWRQLWNATAAKPAGSSATQSAEGESGERGLYILPMFPYPSGNLHLGHLRVYTIADVVARHRRLQGRGVMLPMGWDAFGLPAENAAIERGIDPATWTRTNIARMREQLDLMNASFDWSRELATCDPAFYKETQRIFLLLHKNGLASQKSAHVNWDPVDKTVLANEQVDADGRSWRSGAKVEKRELKQWFFHITSFQDSLLRDMQHLGREGAWPERVLAMQKNWLGRTEGAYYEFIVKSRHSDVLLPVRLYTTRPETIFAAQYIALAPTSTIARQVARTDKKLSEFIARSLQEEKQPPSLEQGYLIPHLTAASPLQFSTGHFNDGAWPGTLPVYVAPYVRGDYETGAIMGVPAHDCRDHTFWTHQRPGEPIRIAVAAEKNGPTEGSTTLPFVEPGYMTSLAGNLSQQRSEEAGREVVKAIREKSGLAESKVKWKLRDWLISRQRYWGCPIPIIHCSSCGPQPVPEEQLPVLLPELQHHWAGGKTGNPLESATEWINTTCPKCGSPAKRDTDTMDTFVDSSWYYMRFADHQNGTAPISEAALRDRLPVDLYIGGVEHAILHLLYARFVYKAVTQLLYPHLEPRSDLPQEPFKRLITQGMVHGKTYSDPATGRFLMPSEVDLSNPSTPKVIATGQSATVTFEKMSKSKNNGVDPTVLISRYGADATRAHMLFQAPVSDVVNWDEDKIVGVTRWLGRVHDFVQTLSPAAGTSSWSAHEYFGVQAGATRPKADVDVWRATQTTIINVSRAYDHVYSLNTSVSQLMSLTNTLVESPDASSSVKAEAAGLLLRMMAPITPALAEECWRMLHPSAKSIFDPASSGGWPVPDGTLKLLEDSGLKCAVMVNGKLRCVVQIPARPAHMADGSDDFKSWITRQILTSDEARARLARVGCDVRNAKKVFPVKGGRTVNYVM